MIKRQSSLRLVTLMSIIVAWAIVTPTLAVAADDTVELNNLHSRGSGDIIAVEYVDLECVYCKRLFNTMLKVMETYDGKLVWGYKNFPLTTLHPNAKKESLASECAAEQGKLYRFMKRLFRKTTFSNNLTNSKLTNFAVSVGAEPKQFRQCLKSRKYLKRVNRDMKEGERLGIVGVPTMLIVDANGTILDQIVGAQSEDDIATVLDNYID